MFVFSLKVFFHFFSFTDLLRTFMLLLYVFFISKFDLFLHFFGRFNLSRSRFWLYNDWGLEIYLNFSVQANSEVGKFVFQQPLTKVSYEDFHEW